MTPRSLKRLGRNWSRLGLGWDDGGYKGRYGDDGAPHDDCFFVCMSLLTLVGRGHRNRLQLRKPPAVEDSEKDAGGPDGGGHKAGTARARMHWRKLKHVKWMMTAKLSDKAQEVSQTFCDNVDVKARTTDTYSSCR